MFIDMEVIFLATEVCRLFITLKSVGDSSALPESEQDRKIKHTLILRTCRLISNFTACGETARAHMFNLIEGTSLSLVPLISRCDAFCSSRPFLCQLLLAVMPSNKLSLDISAECRKNGSNSAGTHGDDPALEWFHMWAFLLVRQSLVYRVYAAVGPSVARSGRGKEEIDGVLAVTHEQVRVLLCYTLHYLSGSSQHNVVSFTSCLPFSRS
jgi:hypothetical protein